MAPKGKKDAAVSLVSFVPTDDELKAARSMLSGADSKARKSKTNSMDAFLVANVDANEENKMILKMDDHNQRVGMEVTFHGWQALTVAAHRTGCSAKLLPCRPPRGARPPSGRRGRHRGRWWACRRQPLRGVCGPPSAAGVSDERSELFKNMRMLSFLCHPRPSPRTRARAASRDGARGAER